MAFINKHSCECTKSELDLFAVPPTQTSILKGQWVQFNPLTNVVDSDLIEFNVTGSTEHYLDLAHTIFNVRAKIVKENGTDLEDDDVVAPTNLLLHSMFSEVDITLNDKLISASSNTYPYRAILETLLTYGPAAKSSQLTSALFYKDEAGKMNSVDPKAADANSGLKRRHDMTKGSRVVDLLGPIHGDVFFSRQIPA